MDVNLDDFIVRYYQEGVPFGVEGATESFIIKGLLNSWALANANHNFCTVAKGNIF